MALLVTNGFLLTPSKGYVAKKGRMIITNKFESFFGVNCLGSFELLYELVVF
jgi:hypothetical protein